jgi:Family of unknown function (DUF5771)
MNGTCGAGKIRRKGYKTKHGKTVRASMIKDRGAPGKWAELHGPGIGPLKEGELSSRGYSVSKSKTSRHRALRKTVRALGPLSTFRKLNAIATYTKRTAKGKSAKFKTDRNWVKKTFM